MVKGIALLQQTQEDAFEEYTSKTFIKKTRQWWGVLLNFTLVYGVLAAMLALVYLGVQMLLGGTQLALVSSTLAIAALFQPVRNRLQSIVGHSLYRRRYDATHLIEDFSVVLRNEVDVDVLSEQLLTVVQETMQSTQVSLWIFKPGTRVRSTDLYQGFGSRITADLIKES